MVRATSPPLRYPALEFCHLLGPPHLKNGNLSSGYPVWKTGVPAVKLHMGWTEPLFLHRTWTYEDNTDERNVQKTLSITHKGDLSSSENHCKRFDGTGRADYGIETRQLDRRMLQIAVTRSCPGVGKEFYTSASCPIHLQHQNLFFFTVLLNPENSKSSYTFQLAEHTSVQETDCRSSEVKANFNAVFLTQVRYLFLAAQFGASASSHKLFLMTWFVCCSPWYVSCYPCSIIAQLHIDNNVSTQNLPGNRQLSVAARWLFPRGLLHFPHLPLCYLRENKRTHCKISKSFRV